MLLKMSLTLSLIMFVALFALMTSFTTATAVANFEKGAKIPPPTLIQSNSTVQSNQKYLLDGMNIISQYDSDTVQLGGTTYATQTVDSIGANFFLQRWNGSSWVDIDNGLFYSVMGNDIFKKGILYTTETGYYYRVRTVQWVSEGGTYEESERVSDYVLLN